jgi:membrane-associated phospholipid phosphatase
VNDPARARRLGAWIAVALGFGFSALTLLVASSPADPPLVGGIDRAWRELALDVPTWAQRASRLMATLGSGAVMVPVRIVVALALLRRRRYPALGAWLLAWAVADAVTWSLKIAIGRVPPDGVGATSFPSAHAKTAAQIALGLALLVPRQLARGARALAWVVAFAWVIAMAVSRTVLEEHWLSDVVAGSMLGTACALAATSSFGPRTSTRSPARRT